MMTKIEKQIIETWRLHNRVNIFFIENIPDEALKATLSKRGGRDIARQIAHIHNVRVWRLEAFSKKLKIKLTEFEKGESPDKQRLINALNQSGEVMEKYIEFCITNDGDVSNFSLGVVPMLSYYITHEAHHRGSILLTMKQSGYKLTDELKWGIWDWKKL